MGEWYSLSAGIYGAILVEKLFIKKDFLYHIWLFQLILFG